MLFNRKPDEKTMGIIEKAQQIRALFGQKGYPCSIMDFDYYKFLQEEQSGTPHQIPHNGIHHLYYCVLAIKLGYPGAKDSIMQEFEKYPTYEEKNAAAINFLAGRVFPDRDAIARFQQITGIDALDCVWDYLHTEPGREGRDEFMLSFPFVVGGDVDDRQYKTIMKDFNGI